MREPPRRAGERLMTNRALAASVAIGCAVGLAVVLAYASMLSGGFDAVAARTVAFPMLVLGNVGIMLAVATLIIVMSVMNGFRVELLSRILGFNGHAFVGGPLINGPGRDDLIARLRQTPGVVSVMPIVV